VAAAAVLSVGGAARAHVGASVAVAKFTNPTEPVVTNGSPNDTLAPFTWASADASFTVQWTDGDSDPTGRFTFYYLDHQPTFQVTVDDIEGGLGHKIDDLNNMNGGYFASCYCSGDAGVTCPPDVRDPAGNCANQLVWNTSMLAAGTYWLVAVNNDPPFHVYNGGGAPVRIAHGGTALPAAIIIRPDGYGAWDKSYHLQWLADGKAPLTFDLSYGLEDTGSALTPIGPIASAVAATQNADSSYGYDWDISALDNDKAYWVRLKVTDADGNSTYTDSHFGMTVYRQAGMVTTPDMATPPKHGGCDVQPTALPSRGALSLAVLGGLAIAIYAARRGARRP
jgi:hypothetical protein